MLHRPPTSWIAIAPALLLLAGCVATTDEDPESTGSTASALYAGVIDNDAYANDAVVALRIGDSSPFELCTGALIAPNVVLTARHCVSRNITDDIDCDEKGISKNGDQVADDVAPRTVHVMMGPKPDFNAVPAANGRLIFRPAGKTICNTDIALVVLDRRITTVAPLKLRLTGGVQTGETIRAVGYGQNDKNVRLGTRFRKEALKILGTGPAPRNGSSGRPAIASNEFEVGRSICQGDSGGPAISEQTGAVVGVVSRGVDCNLDFGHIYTRTSGFNRLFTETFAEAGGAPLEEPDPSKLPPSGGPGGSGTRAASEAATARNSANVRDGGDGSGCSVTSPLDHSAGTGRWGLAMAGMAALLFRRRRRGNALAD